MSNNSGRIGGIGSIAAMAMLAAGMVAATPADVFFNGTVASGKAPRADASKGMPSKATQQRQLKGVFNTRYGHQMWFGKLPAAGWSVATDRRRAKKAKRVARNRAAHR